MGYWNPHENPKDNKGFESVADIVNDIADRALGESSERVQRAIHRRICNRLY
jgi:hypothetical protein